MVGGKKKARVNYDILKGSRRMKVWEQVNGKGPANKHRRRDLVQYFRTIGIKKGKLIDEYVRKTKKDNNFHVTKFREFVAKSRAKGEVSSARLDVVHKPVVGLLAINDIDLRSLARKNIRKSIGRVLKINAKNRAPLPDLQKLLHDYPKDLRFRAILLVLSASGMRLEEMQAYPNGMLFEHLELIEDPKQGKLASLQVYSKKNERIAFKFLTPEALEGLEAYLDYRREKGEVINGKTPLFRDAFEKDVNFTRRRPDHRHPEVHDPKRMQVTSFSRIIVERMKRSGIRTEEPLPNVARHEWSPEGIRHRFAYEAHGVLPKTAEVELLMDHEGGLHQTYVEADKSDMLKTYLKLIPVLTIDPLRRLKLQESGETADALVEQKAQTEQVRITNEALGHEVGRVKEEKKMLDERVDRYEKINEELKQEVGTLTSQVKKIDAILPLDVADSVLKILKDALAKKGIDVKDLSTKPKRMLPKVTSKPGGKRAKFPATN